jgi:hypothetical protein
VIFAVIIVVCALLWWYASRYYKSPEKPPEYNMSLSVASVALSVVTLAQAFLENSYVSVFIWQNSLIKIAGIITALYYLAFAVRYYVKYKFPNYLHIIPCCFIILRTVFIFINTSALAHISDNVLLLSSYCTVMIFFVNFAKLYNRIDIEKNFRKLLSSGLVSSVLCLTQSLSHFVINFASDNRYLHVSHVTNISLFFIGIFILIFIISHFYIYSDSK